jgi:hypothetical protein
MCSALSAAAYADWFLLPPPISSNERILVLKTSGLTHFIMPKRNHIAEGTKPSKKHQRPSSAAAAAASSPQQSSAAAFMQRMDSFSTSAIVRDASGSVRMVSRDKGLNVVAQLTGMGINEQLCRPSLAVTADSVCM